MGWHRKLPLLALGVLAYLVGPARTDDWPSWRGPDRTGVSKETGLLKEWPKEGPPLVWKAKDLGAGYGGPAIAAGRVYLMASKNGSEFVVALEEKDGKKVWESKVGVEAKVQYAGTRCTPSVDGDLLFAISSDGDLVCMKIAKGEVVWRKQMIDELKGRYGNWAYGESPLVDGDLVIVTPGGKDTTIMAFQKKTGAVVWTSAIPDAVGNGGGYSSVVVGTSGGVKQYVQFLSGGVVGVSAQDGKLLWRYSGTVPARGANIPTPIFYEDYVFSTVGYNTGCGLVKLSAADGKFKATEVYFNSQLSNHHGGVVRVGDAVYGTNNNALVCLDFKTGKKKWQERSVGKGSIAAADGCLYVRGENGPVALVEATPTAYKEKSRFTPPDRSRLKAWTHPVIANGKLYLRDQDVLLCYDIKQK
jgi:outer membrane protein assembly factor BamB